MNLRPQDRYAAVPVYPLASVWRATPTEAPSLVYEYGVRGLGLSLLDVFLDSSNVLCHASIGIIPEDGRWVKFRRPEVASPIRLTVVRRLILELRSYLYGAAGKYDQVGKGAAQSVLVDDAVREAPSLYLFQHSQLYRPNDVTFRKESVTCVLAAQPFDCALEQLGCFHCGLGSFVCRGYGMRLQSMTMRITIS